MFLTSRTSSALVTRILPFTRLYSTAKLLDLNPSHFADHLKTIGKRRAYFVFDRKRDGVLERCSHESLEPIATKLSHHADFLDHEALFFEVGEKSGALMCATVHRTNRGGAQGGVRLWNYDTFGDLCKDGLRLAIGMSMKSALAQLWWGGGKGVIHKADSLKWEPGSAEREAVFRDYGKFCASLRGVYSAAEDVGLNVADLNEIYKQCRFTTCISSNLGGSGNPSEATALGVCRAMEAALEVLKAGDLKGKTIAVQGLGNVARFVIDELLRCGVQHIIASDIDPQAINIAKERYMRAPVEIVRTERGDNCVLREDVDIVSPNALGGVLNDDTIPEINARVVCGAANNQLATASDGLQLHNRGILYVPDMIANRCGIVNCANEHAGNFGDSTRDPAISRHFEKDWQFSIYQVALRVLSASLKEGVPTSSIAMHLAEEFTLQPHPIWGADRFRDIRDSLLVDGWADQKVKQ